MKRSLTITTDPIDEPALIRERRMSDSMGAAIYFAGVVRGQEGGHRIAALEYEAFTRMATHQFHQLFDQLEQRWAIESVRLIHRVGTVPVNAASLWIEIIAAHRGEAFAAGQWLIDEMKRFVPIWKKPVPPA